MGVRVSSNKITAGIALVFVLTFFAQVPAFAQEAGAERVIVVAPGETLSELAERYGTTTDALVSANGLASPDFIKAGQRLVFGAPESRPGAGELPGRGDAPAAGEAHVVQRGDTIIGIAAAHGASVDAMVAANGLSNPNRIWIGQVLKMPRLQPASVPAEPAPTPPPPPETRILLSTPYRSQFDGSPYEESDCGPATLGMLLNFYGEDVSTASLRRWVMESSGYWGYDYGSDWKSLVYAAKKAGFQADGLYDGPGRYRRWSFDDVVSQLEAGNPVMVLVRYRNLPGHTGSSWWGDHYVLIVGVRTDGQVVYHDSAFSGQANGAYKVMSREALQRAWSSVSVGIQYSGMYLKK